MHTLIYLNEYALKQGNIHNIFKSKSDEFTNIQNVSVLDSLK